MTGNLSDFEEYNKQLAAEQAGVRYWTDIISKGYDAYKQAATSQIDTQAQYDVSEAYSNYLKNQMALRNAGITSDRYQNMGSAYIKNNLTNNVAGIRQQQFSDILKTQESIENSKQSAMDTFLKSVKDKSEAMANLMPHIINNMYKQLGEGTDTGPEWLTRPFSDELFGEDTKSNATFTDEGNQVFFEQDVNGNLRLTDDGKKLIGQTAMGPTGYNMKNYITSLGDPKISALWDQYGADVLNALGATAYSDHVQSGGSSDIVSDVAERRRKSNLEKKNSQKLKAEDGRDLSKAYDSYEGNVPLEVGKNVGRGSGWGGLWQLSTTDWDTDYTEKDKNIMNAATSSPESMKLWERRILLRDAYRGSGSKAWISKTIHDLDELVKKGLAKEGDTFKVKDEYFRIGPGGEVTIKINNWDK